MDGHAGHAHHGSGRIDWLLWICGISVLLLYATHLLTGDSAVVPAWLHTLGHGVYELMNTIWWGIVLGVLMISVLGRVPRELVMSALGTRRGPRGVVRATLAGVLLDLCSHGILMVGAKLYERGASAGLSSRSWYRALGTRFRSR